MIDPADIRANDRAWERHDQRHAEHEWERQTRERLADKCSVPLTLVDSMNMREVETLLRAA